VKVGIIGASGYTGFELLRILLRHPEVEVTVLTAERFAGKGIEEVFPPLKGLPLPPFEPLEVDRVAERADLFFTALPHGTSMEVVKALFERGKRVVDLSADFRLRDPSLYERWYGPHRCPELLKEAVYGLPEVHRERIKGASLVANPGCYPTGAILALMPLASEGLLPEEGVVIDAKSGVSGAGRAPSQGTHFCEVAEAIRAYNVRGHRHSPEMDQELSSLQGRRVRVNFTPHLVPMNRGILSTIYVPLEKELKEEGLYELYMTTYSEEPFIRLCEPGRVPSTSEVRGTNFCDIGLVLKGRSAVVISAIDNLTKGASGQAVQNMNLMLGLVETLGLEDLSLFP